MTSKCNDLPLLQYSSTAIQWGEMGPWISFLPVYDWLLVGPVMCSHNTGKQLLGVCDCNGCVLPRRQHFTAFLPVFHFFHGICSTTEFMEVSSNTKHLTLLQLQHLEHLSVFVFTVSYLNNWVFVAKSSIFNMLKYIFSRRTYTLSNLAKQQP